MIKNTINRIALGLASCATLASAGSITPEAKQILQQQNISDPAPLQQRLDQLNQDIAEKGILYHVGHQAKLLTGYSYHQVYDWDAYFENLYLSYYGVSQYCYSNTISFLKLQQENGFINRCIDLSRPTQHFKPFLAQMAELGSRQTGDYTWVTHCIDGDKLTILQRLEKSIEYWFEQQDTDKNGLPTWNSADHSGMDNQWGRAGGMDAFEIEGVDLASYLHREYQAMATIANKLGMRDKEQQYKNKAKTLAEKVNQYLWDEQDGIYYDRNEKTGKTVGIKAVSAFTPLFAGIASKEQADRLVKEHITNPDEFWMEYPVSTYAKTEKDYNPNNIMRGDYTVCNWTGPAWVPTNYMVYHGLMDYGYTDIAKQLANKTFEMVYKKNGITREFYMATTGQGLGLERFWGWSSLGYTMIMENGLNYNPSKIGGEIKRIIKDNLGISFPKSPEKLYEIGK